MPSSLATQLAKGTSLNAPLLSESQRKKHFASSSYLFSTSTKAQIDDLDSIHALAESALTQLRLAYPENECFAPTSSVHRTLFSQRARETDRTLLTTDALAEVDAAIRTCLRALGPYLLEDQAGRVIEWLVRRFRINELNVDDVLFVFLPYHESAHFAKMVSILTIDASAPWAFLAGYKASGRPLQRTALVSEMLRNVGLARSVLSILPESLTSDGGSVIHRTLLYFNTATAMEFFTRGDKKHFDAAMLAFIVPSLTCPLEMRSEHALGKDLILGSFILFSALSQKVSLTPQATRIIATKMINAAAAASQQIDAYHLFTALISFIDPQADIEAFSSKAARAAASLLDCGEALVRSLGWKGADKLLTPLLPGLLDHSHFELVESIIMAEEVPRSISQLIAAELLSRDDDKSTQLLSTMHQRHLDAIQAAIDDISITDENIRGKLEARVVGLISPVFAGNNVKGIIIASHNADASVRKSAVRSISQLVDDASHSLDDDERASLREALLARVFDGNASVLEALYANPGPIAKLINENLDSVEELAKSLVEQGLSKSILRAHLEFFCNAFLELYPEHTPRVVLSLITPFMLRTKSRAKTAALVWEVALSSGLGTSEVMAKLKEITRMNGGETCSVNEEVAKQLAENLRGTSVLHLYLDGFVERASLTTDPHARLSAWLILRQLFPSLSVEARLFVLQHIFNVKTLERIIESSDPGKKLAFDEEGLQIAIFSKPSSTATLTKLQLSFLSSLPASLFSGTYKAKCFSSKTDQITDLLKVYYIISSSILPVKAASSPGASLFVSLGSSSLLFLADVWTAPPDIGGIEPDTVAYIALRHALAFIQAREAAISLEDLQAAIPALLHPLQSTSKKVREAAVQCFSAMAVLGKKGNPKTVYGYDEIYGPASEMLRYLEWDDELKLVQDIAEHKDHLTNSHGSLAMLFSDKLAPAKSSGKKETKQRRRILSFLLSHVVCCPRTTVQTAILQAISRVSDASKLQMLTPLLQDALKDDAINPERMSMVTQLVGCIDKSSAKELNEENSAMWTSLLASLEIPNSPLRRVASIWARFSKHVVDGLFDALSSNRQLELSLKLIDMGVKGDDELGVKSLLRNCFKDPRLVIRAMQSLLSDIKESSERVTKKAKVDRRTSSTDASSMVLLAFFLEILVSQSLPASLELLSELLEALNRVISSTVNTLDSDGIYVVQLLMSSLDSCGSQIKELPNIAPSSIRFDVLVELMRTSENPQTFQQALMLMANLARLSPASMLSHIMPIFTFMGSNVFHRDDTYSFKVIQKTIEEIVPVAAASLREKYTESRTLMLESRSLLRMFTDAQNHVPRHRRTNFFTRLVNVLGPAEYLAPVAMLLAEKSTNRVSRQDFTEAQSHLVLPLDVMKHYEGTVKLSALKEVVLEVERMMTSMGMDGSGELFLDMPISDDSHTSKTVLRKRQIHTLLVLVGHTMKQISHNSDTNDNDGYLKGIVSLLLSQSVRTGETEHTDKRTTLSAARWALVQTMKVLSVGFFVSTALSMLDKEDPNIIRGALELLAVRVPIIGSQARKSVSPEMSSIVQRITDIVVKAQDSTLISDALRAMNAIARSVQQEEEAALGSAVPVVIETIKRQPDSIEALSMVPVLITKLGPRIIAQLSHTVEACVAAASLGHADVVKLAHDSLHGLIKTVPSFWSTRGVANVIDYCLSQGATDTLVKSMAKQLPSKVLLSAVIQSWPAVDTLNERSSARLSRFFDLLRRCLHHIAPSDIHVNLKSLYEHFIGTFDLRGLSGNVCAFELEDKAIAAFIELVVKLNEAAFQPLFRRMCDWAFGDGDASSRVITFCRVYSALLDLFKELMSPYMSLLHAHFVELMTAFEKGDRQDSELWRTVVQMLGKSFAVDDGVFWHDTRIRPLIVPIVGQLATSLLSSTVSSFSSLSVEMQLFVDALSGIFGCTEDDALVKDTNLKVLMHTQSEDVRVRLAAVQSSIAVWESQGHKLRGFASETAAFILECAEDENDEVARAARKLRDAVEKASGKIDGL